MGGVAPQGHKEFLNTPLQAPEALKAVGFLPPPVQCSLLEPWRNDRTWFFSYTGLLNSDRWEMHFSCLIKVQVSAASGCRDPADGGHLPPGTLPSPCTSSHGWQRHVTWHRPGISTEILTSEQEKTRPSVTGGRHVQVTGPASSKALVAAFSGQKPHQRPQPRRKDPTRHAAHGPDCTHTAVFQTRGRADTPSPAPKTRLGLRSSPS